jgi:sugar lactone lactonase YvrE
MGHRITRFPVTKHGLGRREVMHKFGPGELPDGFAFDSEGAAWVACVVSNRVIRIEANGRRTLILDDGDQDVIDRAEAQYQRGLGGREGLEGGARRSLRNIASVAFGGADLKTVYLGCLNGTGVVTFASPIAGAEPVQWRW